MSLITSETIASNSSAYEWDEKVVRLTNNFQSGGATIIVHVGGGVDAKRFQVERVLIANHLPGIKELMNGDNVVICDDVQDFEDFLWFIHVNPMSFANYLKKCPPHEKFRRALGIGTVASSYGSTDITQWATAELLGNVGKFGQSEHRLRLHRFAMKCRSTSSQLYEEVLTLWRTSIRANSDPVAALLDMREMEDENLQAYAYYCIVRTHSYTIAKDARLTTLDRLRLALGSLGLPPNPCTCYPTLEAPTTCVVCTQAAHGGRSLWDIFTRSDIGISLADNSLDLSFLARTSVPNQRTAENDEASPGPVVDVASTWFE